MRCLGALLWLSLAASALAQTYSVDVSGSPAGLSEELARAAAAWNEAAEEAELEQAAGAPTTFTLVDPELLGPDVVSATIVREGEAGFDVWLNPEALEEFPQALLHELGLLLGLPSARAGVMDPALSAETPPAPTEADREALTVALAQAGGDIDGNGVVDIHDLAALGRAYGQSGVNLAADLDGNGVVDAQDVALLQENYSFTEPAPVVAAESEGDVTEAGDPAEASEPETEEPDASEPNVGPPDQSPDDASERGASGAEPSPPDANGAGSEPD